MTPSAAVPFTFQRVGHIYTRMDTGVRVPSITQLLKAAGLIDDSYYTAESAARGSAVHELCEAYDHGVLDVERCESPFVGYLDAYAHAKNILHPMMLAIEKAAVHPTLGFAGRPDRAIKLQGVMGSLEIKSGAEEKHHAIQLAMQCELIALDAHLPPEQLGRWALYVSANGRFRFVEHTNRHDFTVARDILRRFA